MDTTIYQDESLDLVNYQAVVFLEALGNVSPSQKQIDCIERLLKSSFKNHLSLIHAHKSERCIKPMTNIMPHISLGFIC